MKRILMLMFFFSLLFDAGPVRADDELARLLGR